MWLTERSSGVPGGGRMRSSSWMMWTLLPNWAFQGMRFRSVRRVMWYSSTPLRSRLGKHNHLTEPRAWPSGLLEPRFVDPAAAHDGPLDGNLDQRHWIDAQRIVASTTRSANLPAVILPF